MNIWLIQTGEPLPLDDSVKRMRTGLLAEMLVAGGHSVTWWTSAFDHMKKQWVFEKDTERELKPDLRIIALKGTGYKNNFSLSRFIDHRIVAKKFFRMAKQVSKPDIIIASMPPHDIAYMAVKFAKENNIPALVDIRDPWPDIFLEHIPAFLRALAKTILFNEFSMVRKTMKMADGLVAVEDSFLQWGLKYAGRRQNENDKIFPLGYQKPSQVNLSFVNRASIDLAKELENKFVVFFVGAISKSYHNPLILVEAAKILRDKRDIHFVIAGDGELLSTLKSEAEKADNISFTGWIGKDEIEFWLNHSAIGVCPVSKKSELPTNKAYAYLSAGLPLVSSFDGELRQLIEKENIGIYYPPGDVTALVTAILKLYDDKLLYQNISMNAQRVFDKLFDAEKIFEEYIKHAEVIVTNYRKK